MDVVVARVGAPHGIHGDLKLHLFLEDASSIHDFKSLFIKRPQDKVFQVLRDFHIKEKGMHTYIHFVGMTDRDQARIYTHAEIAVPRADLPVPEEGRFYWDDLIGLSVFDLNQRFLGTLKSMMATGANDVMVLCTEAGKEKLIPYVRDHVVKSVDLAQKKMIVDWEM